MGIAALDKGVTLADKLLGPGITLWQSNADAKTIIQGALALRVAEYIREFPRYPEVIDMLARCGGRLGISNLCHIIQLAQQQLTDDAKPELISDDWFSNFREKAKTCSNEEIAELWASLLADEANNHGSFSRKTVNILGGMDYHDAIFFKDISKYVLVGMATVHLVMSDDVINDNSVILNVLSQLGLVRVAGQFHLTNDVSYRFFGYNGGILEVVCHSERNPSLGPIELTPSGAELIKLCIPNKEQQIDEIIKFLELSAQVIEVKKHSFGFFTPPPVSMEGKWFLYHDVCTGTMHHIPVSTLEGHAKLIKTRVLHLREDSMQRMLEYLQLVSGKNLNN